MRLTPLCLMALVFGFVVNGTWSCTPQDNERCGGPTYWDDGNKSCLPVMDGGDDTNDMPELPEGMGEPCTSLGLEAECAEFDAAYCVLQPGKSVGYCTLHECTAEPNDCPRGYRCCDFAVASMPNFCATTDDYFLMGSMCLK